MIIPVTVEAAVASPRYKRVLLVNVNIIMNPFMIPNCCEKKLKNFAALIRDQRSNFLILYRKLMTETVQYTLLSSRLAIMLPVLL